MTRIDDHGSSKLGEGLLRSAWLDAANYDYTHRLTRRGWAWEFLRRNKHYAADWNLVQNEVRVLPENSRFARLRLDVGASQMQRWGLIFRRRTGQKRRRR